MIDYGERSRDQKELDFFKRENESFRYLVLTTRNFLRDMEKVIRYNRPAGQFRIPYDRIMSKLERIE